MAKNWISKLPPSIKWKILKKKKAISKSIQFLYIAQLKDCQKLDFKGAGWRGQPQLGDAVPVLTITPQKNRFELWIHDMSNRWSPKH